MDNFLNFEGRGKTTNKIIDTSCIHFLTKCGVKVRLLVKKSESYTKLEHIIEKTIRPNPVLGDSNLPPP